MGTNTTTPPTEAVTSKNGGRPRRDAAAITAEIVKFRETHGRLPRTSRNGVVGAGDLEHDLGATLRDCRSRRRRGALGPRWSQLLDTQVPGWDQPATRGWSRSAVLERQARFADRVKAYLDAHGTLPARGDRDNGGVWLSNLRARAARGALPADTAQILEERLGQSWREGLELADAA